MKSTKILIVLVLALGLMVWSAELVGAAPMGTAFTYQGRLMDANSAAEGLYDFQFKLYDANAAGTQQGSTIDINDLDVIDGYFRVELDFGNVFTGEARWLEIGVRQGELEAPNEYARLSPRQQVTPTPYAVYAMNARKYAHVVVVAKSGGDYTSVQAAIDSISDAAAERAYLVWIAPGVYNELVTMKAYIHLQGAGQDVTVIDSNVSTSSYPPTQGTVRLTHHVSLRNLTVRNSGTGMHNTALLATASTAQTLVADMTTRVQGAGTNNYAVFMNGIGTGVTLQHVIALSENGSSKNYGLHNYQSAMVTVREGFFAASGGTYAVAVYNFESSLDIQNSTLSASHYGMQNAASSGIHSVKVTHCQVSGSYNTILNNYRFVTYVGACLLDGGMVGGNGGTMKCAGCWDGNYNFYTNTCP